MVIVRAQWENVRKWERERETVRLLASRETKYFEYFKEF